MKYPLVLALLGVAACKGSSGGAPEVSDEVKAANGKLVAAVQAKFEPLELERRAALKAAFTGAIVPRSDLGPCPVKLMIANPLDHKPGETPKFDLDRMERQVHDSMRASIGRFPTQDEAASLPGPPWGETMNQLRPDVPTAELQKRIAEIEKPGYWDWDLVVVKTAEQRAVKVGDDKFTGGNFVGRAWLWSFSEHKLVCAGDIAIQLEKIKSRGDDVALAGSVGLGFRVLKEARDKMVVAGPPADAK
jgi:hypothetical protein